jgi:hypothetical protein
MFILLSCICRVLGTQGESRMSDMCASVAFCTSFKKKVTESHRLKMNIKDPFIQTEFSGMFSIRIHYFCSKNPKKSLKPVLWSHFFLYPTSPSAQGPSSLSL